MEANDCAPPYGYYTLDKDSRAGAITQEEADQKRESFLRYLEHSYPQYADAVSTKALHEVGVFLVCYFQLLIIRQRYSL